MSIQQILGRSKMHELSMDYMMTARTIDGFYQTLLRGYGLTPIQWLVLGVTADETKNGGIRVTDLALVFDVKTTYVTSTLNELRVRGYVATKYASNDARVRLAVITPLGARQIDTIEQRMQAEMADLLDGVVSPRDLDVYMRSLKKLAASRRSQD